MVSFEEWANQSWIGTFASDSYVSVTCVIARIHGNGSEISSYVVFFSQEGENNIQFASCYVLFLRKQHEII